MNTKHFYIAVFDRVKNNLPQITVILMVVAIIGIINLRIDLSAAESMRDAYKLQSERYLEALRKANSEINKANKLYDSGLIINLTEIE